MEIENNRLVVKHTNWFNYIDCLNDLKSMGDVLVEGEDWFISDIKGAPREVIHKYIPKEADKNDR